MKTTPLVIMMIFALRVAAQNDQVYTIVQSMPTPQTCADLEGVERRSCTQNTVRSYVQEHVVYPKQAIDKQLRGTAYVSFVIDEEGKIGTVQLLKGLAGAKELDEEAIRVVSSLGELDWIPGMQDGKEVKVRMNLPVKFNPPKPKPEIPAK